MLQSAHLNLSPTGSSRLLPQHQSLLLSLSSSLVCSVCSLSDALKHGSLSCVCVLGWEFSFGLYLFSLLSFQGERVRGPLMPPCFRCHSYLVLFKFLIEKHILDYFFFKTLFSFDYCNNTFSRIFSLLWGHIYLFC